MEVKLEIWRVSYFVDKKIEIEIIYFVNAIYLKISKIQYTNITTMAYEKVNKCFLEKGCKLLTTKEEYGDSTKVQKVKFVASCGHENEVFTNVFIYRYTGVICKKCLSKKQSTENRSVTVNYHEQEHEGFLKLQSIIGEFFEMKKTHEGCLADCAIRPIQSTEDIWLSIQLKVNKTPKFNMCSFNITNNYANCLIACVQLDLNKFWIIDGNIELPRRLNITQTYSKYDEHLISNDKLVEFFQDMYDTYFKDSFENINIPVNINARLEQKFEKLREDKVGLDFQYPEIQQSVCDFTFEGKRFQEKVGSVQAGKKAILFTLHKHNGKHAMQSYVKGDNDFYWFHHPNMSIFYVVPEKELIDRELISLTAGGKQKSISICHGDETKKHSWTEEFKFEYDNLNLDELLTLIRS